VPKENLLGKPGMGAKIVFGSLSELLRWISSATARPTASCGQRHLAAPIGDRVQLESST